MHNPLRHPYAVVCPSCRGVVQATQVDDMIRTELHHEPDCTLMADLDAETDLAKRYEKILSWYLSTKREP